MEIKEQHVPNSGRDAFPIYLRRQKLPLNPSIMQPGLAREEAETYLDESLIVPDEQLNIFSQKLTILGVDAFTQKFYADEFGRDFTLWQPKAAEPKRVEVQIPPHNGFGNEDDALGYV